MSREIRRRTGRVQKALRQRTRTNEQRKLLLILRRLLDDRGEMLFLPTEEIILKDTLNSITALRQLLSEHLEHWVCNNLHNIVQIL